MNIKINKNDKALKEGLFWNDIPNLAILTGKNGCGKSQLLEFIKNNSEDILEGWSCNSAEINHIHELTNQGSSIQPPPDEEDIIKKLIIYNKNPSSLLPSHKDALTKDEMQALLKEIKDTLRKQEITDEDIKNNLPVNCLNRFLDVDSIQNHIRIVELKRREEIVKQHDAAQGETMQRILEKSPCDEINEIFEQYDQDFRLIKTPITKENQPFPLIFEHTKTGQKVRFDHLSSGEQMIVRLVMLAHTPRVGYRVKLLLLDEFDRHFHPTLCDLFLEILSEKIVKEYGIRVILATHSLATIALSQENSLFLMEKDSLEINRISKTEATKSISDNTLSFEEGSRIAGGIQASSKNLILLTEGPSDVNHITIAKSKLNIDMDFDIFSCNGADKLKQFLVGCPANMFARKTIVGIFDQDKEGIKQFKGFGREVDSNKSFHQSNDGNEIYALLLPEPEEGFKKYENLPIEFLYKKEVLERFNILGGKIRLDDINRLYRKDENWGESDYKTQNDLWFYRVKDDDSEKKNFSKEITKLQKEEFENFRKLFLLISEISEKTHLTKTNPDLEPFIENLKFSEENELSQECEKLESN